MNETLRLIFRGTEDAFFIQVGSHDGIQDDPLHKLILEHEAWKGVFVEPVPHLHGQLKQNYGNSSRFVFERAAIGRTTGVVSFYSIAPDARTRSSQPLPEWCEEIGSLDRNHLVKHLDGALEPYIRCDLVECLTLPALIERHAIERIDLLHIDAEGADCAILSQLDLQRFSPRAIIYEHMHLEERERRSAEAFLSSWGYELRWHGLDTLAVRTYR